tara:strand:- start:22496 stop:23056 length:561 start_codon:yes stop_codon:yes gene_type:complete
MTLNKNIKSVAIVLHFASFMLVCLMSCNFALKNKNVNSNVTNDETMSNHKQEAKLLVKASQNNLDVIKLCQLLEDSEPEQSIGILAKDIENRHFEILKDYKEVAQENLISIPNYASFESKTKNTAEAHNNIEKRLSTIDKKMNNQIDLMNKLAETSNNTDFKELSEKTNSILKSNLEKTANTINNL